MINCLFDNTATRWLGKKLEHNHYSTIGIHRTMRVAQAFNKIKNRNLIRFRKDLYENKLDELYAENGEIVPTSIKMSDGWTMDRSQSLPHLEQLIQESQTVIEERGGISRGGGDRAHFQQILNDGYYKRFSSILDFATSNEVLRPVIDYLGFIPTLSVMKPLGVRLNESDIRFCENPDGQFQASQLFHRDYQGLPMVYVIVALRDVTHESGPFSILGIEASNKVTEAIGYGRHGGPYRLTDDQMYKIVDKDKLIEMNEPSGTVLFLDSSQCFHYGSRDAEIPRYLMMYAYVSVCRTDFGDLLRKESKTPVLDDRARLHRSRYPIKDTDSRLRRMVLDRSYVF